MPPCREVVGAAVYQDFKQDIYDALSEGISQLQKYRKLILVYPNRLVYPYPREILAGFRQRHSPQRTFGHHGDQHRLPGDGRNCSVHDSKEQVRAGEEYLSVY